MVTSPAHRVVALAVGGGFLLVGIVGIVLGRETAFFGATAALAFGIFGVNPALSIVHILLGATLLLAGIASARPAKIAGNTVGMLLLALGFLGLAIVGTELNVLALNGADNVLHFASASLLLAIGLGAGRREPKPS